MPTVLFIATAYPPAAISGSQRSGCFAKYLHRMGWNVVVVTPEVPAFRRDESIVPNLPELPVYRFRDALTGDGISAGIRRQLARHTALGMMTWGGFPRATLASGKQAVLRALAEHDVDVIHASFVRPVAVRLGAWAHRQTGIPWLAEFRDSIEMILGPMQSRIALVGECSQVRTAERLIAVSEPVAINLRSRHRQPVHVIQNGYDPDGIVEEPAQRPAPFTIVHAGKLYATRDPRPLYRAIDRVIEEGVIAPGEIRVRMIGAANVALNRHRVAELTAGLVHPEVVVNEPALPRAEVLRAQREAHLMLLLPGLLKQRTGNVPAKLYEYLAARRPILSLTSQPQPEIRRILNETSAGVSVRNEEDTVRELRRQIERWRRGGSTALTHGSRQLEPYSRETQTRQLASLLTEVIGRR